MVIYQFTKQRFHMIAFDQEIIIKKSLKILYNLLYIHNKTKNERDKLFQNKSDEYMIYTYNSWYSMIMYTTMTL